MRAGFLAAAALLVPSLFVPAVQVAAQGSIRLIGSDVTPPSISFTPSGTTVTAAPIAVRVAWCDDETLRSQQVKLNGAALAFTVAPSTKAGCARYAYADLSLPLAAGANTLWSQVCDLYRCASAGATYTLVSDASPPVVTLSPGGRSTPYATLPGGGEPQRIHWCDNGSLDAASRRVTVNGAAVATDWVPETPTAGCPVRATSTVTHGARLLQGGNTLSATICDLAGRCGTAMATVDFVLPVDTRPTIGTHRDASLCALACFEGRAAHTTPAYVSRDLARALRLRYSSAQAAPATLVQVDVNDGSAVPAHTFSLRLRRPDGSWLPLMDGAGQTRTEVHFRNPGGAVRLAASIDARSLPTGSHPFTAVVTSYWSDRAPISVSAPVRVLVVNERASEIGTGWSLAGMRRLHVVRPTEVVITDGEGGGSLFTRCSGCAEFVSPPGEPARLQVDRTGYMLTELDETRTSFSSTGFATFFEDRFGNRTTYLRDGQNRLTGVRDPVGKTITLSYDAAGKLAAITDPVGRRTDVTVDASGRLARIVDPDGVAAFQGTYDADGRLLTWSGRMGATWGLLYDAWGKVRASISPSFLAGTATVRDTARFRSLESTVLPVTPAGSLAQPATPATGETPALAIDSRGDTTRLTVDAWGGAARVVDPDGYVTREVRNDVGLVTKRVAADGDSTTYGWTGYRIGRVTDPDGRQTLYFRDGPSGEVGSIQHDGMLAAIYHYDRTAGRPWTLDSVYAPGAGTTHYRYDATGRLLETADSAGHSLARAYDPAGLHNLRSETTDGARTTMFARDSAGRVTTITDARGGVWRREYDALNRERTLRDALGGDTRVHAGATFADSVTVPSGDRYRYRRNAMGWVDRITAPDGAMQTTEYDRYGRIAAATNRRGQRIAFGYGADGRLATLTADGQTTTYGYSPANPGAPTAPRWYAVTTPEGTDTSRADPQARTTTAITVRNTMAGPRRFEVRSAYDEDGVRDSLTVVLPDGQRRTTRFHVDARTGLLRGLTEPSGDATGIEYDVEGLPRRITLPTGMEIELTHLSNHLPGSVSYSEATVNATAGGQVRYDATHRVTERFDPAGYRKRAFAYDSAGRLAGYTDWERSGLVGPCTLDVDFGLVCTGGSPWVAGGGVAYAYDRMGNRTDGGSVVQPGNRMTAFGGVSMTYDADGNLATRTAGGTEARLTWNPLGQFVSVTGLPGGTVTYAYDGLGRRVRRTTAAGTTLYLYDGDDLLLETDGTGAGVAEYTYYPGTDRPHSVRRGAATYYYAADMQGNVATLSDRSNAVVGRYRYGPFGAAEMASEAVTNPLRFAGREYETATGLYYFRSRWYDPALGRFVSEDPLGLAGGMNPYVYAGNDPVNAGDPSGLLPECPAGVRGAVQGYWGMCNWVVWLDPINVVAQASSRSLFGEYPGGALAWLYGGGQQYELCGQSFPDGSGMFPVGACARIKRGLQRVAQNPTQSRVCRFLATEALDRANAGNIRYYRGRLPFPSGGFVAGWIKAPVEDFPQIGNWVDIPGTTTFTRAGVVDEPSSANTAIHEEAHHWGAADDGLLLGTGSSLRRLPSASEFAEGCVPTGMSMN